MFIVQFNAEIDKMISLLEAKVERLEAERDALLNERDRWQNSCMREMSRAMDAEAERDALRAEVKRIKEDVCKVLENSVSDWIQKATGLGNYMRPMSRELKISEAIHDCAERVKAAIEAGKETR